MPDFTTLRIGAEAANPRIALTMGLEQGQQMATIRDMEARARTQGGQP